MARIDGYMPSSALGGSSEPIGAFRFLPMCDWDSPFSLEHCTQAWVLAQGKHARPALSSAPAGELQQHGRLQGCAVRFQIVRVDLAQRQVLCQPCYGDLTQGLSVWAITADSSCL